MIDNSYQCEILERAAFQMTSSLDLEEVLTTITKGLVTELDAALARIWLVETGDICERCYNASICSNRERCLHLKASCGISARLDGEYRRIPIKSLHIGQTAEAKRPLITTDFVNDARWPNQKWIRINEIHTYGGYPLLFRDELVGVMGVFSRSEWSQKIGQQVSGFANHAAVAIKNALLFSEVDALKNRLHAENVYMQEEIKRNYGTEEIVGESRAIKKVLRRLEKVAPTDATVLILGDSGTGKELISRAIHHLGNRRERPLVKVNCAAIPSGLLENELFGHEKGAYTGADGRKVGRFELADGSTIFLDEIGDLPIGLQGKLLRVIEEGCFERVGGLETIDVNVRIIAATNRNLEEAIDKGTFRKDLYYRLNVFPITLPPLSERMEDIPDLVRHFVKRFQTKLGKRVDVIPSKTIKALQTYHWPGNVRELGNVIERAMILSKGNKILIDDLLEIETRIIPERPNPLTLREVESAHILKIIEDSGWVIDGKYGAARRLGIHPATLRSRMKKLGIKRPL